jgi:ankyrin repeat protein
MPGSTRAALHFTMQHHTIQVEAARLLLERGADVNARDEYGFTPSQSGNSEMVELISEYGGESVKK